MSRPGLLTEEPFQAELTSEIRVAWQEEFNATFYRSPINFFKLGNIFS